MLTKQLATAFRDTTFTPTPCTISASGPLPVAGDTDAMSAYWKKYYNTPSGRGTKEQYVKLWSSVMA